MPSSRLSLLVAVVVVVALAVLALQCLVVLLQHPHQPVPHAAWRVGASAVVLVGVWWLLNGPLEGPTLVAVTWAHGFTAGDLLGVPPLLLGGAVLALSVRT